MGRFIAEQASGLLQIEGLGPGQGGQGVGGQHRLRLSRQDATQGVGPDRQGLAQWYGKAGFVPIRKKGKLPHETVRVAYSLEYGVDEMEIHMDAVKPGEKVILVDDLIATGGTLLAAAQLVRRMRASIHEAAAIIDLPELGGSQKLQDIGIPTFTLTAFALSDR